MVEETNANHSQSNSPTPSSQGGSGLEPNIASVLCYVCSFVTGIIFLAIEKDNKEVKFHAWQSIFLGGASFAVLIALTIVGQILGAIASFLGVLISALTSISMLGFFVIAIIAIVKAYQGEKWLIPIIGSLADQQANKS